MIASNYSYSRAAALVPTQPMYIFTVEGWGRVFTYLPTGAPSEYAWIVSLGDWGMGVDDLHGSCTIDDLTVTLLDKGWAVTKDISVLAMEGRRCTLKAGFTNIPRDQFITLFSGLVDKVNDSGPSQYDFVCNDYNRLNQRIIYLTGDNGLATSSANTRRIIGHPLDILLDVLQNQVGFADDDINVTQIQAYKDQVFAGMEFDFTIDTAPDAKTFIEQQLLMPLGGYNYTDNLGRYCVCFAQPLPGSVAAAVQLSPANLTAVPQPAQADLVNVLTYRFDLGSDGNYMAQDNEIFSATTDNANIENQLAVANATQAGALQGQLIIESAGARSGFQGFLLAQLVAQSIFAKYGSHNPTMDVATLWNPAFQLEIGDFVSLTHPLVPDRKAGVQGVVGQLLQVKKRTYSFATSTVTLSLTDASQQQALDVTFIAPDTELPIDRGGEFKYIYLSDKDGNYPGVGKAATME